jgi:hypothetical protein
MILTGTMTLSEIQSKGLEILAKELGPIGLIRFLQQFETGRGDYTQERHQWLDESSVAELTEQIMKARKKADNTNDL